MAENDRAFEFATPTLWNWRRDMVNIRTFHAVGAAICMLMLTACPTGNSGAASESGQDKELGVVELAKTFTAPDRLGNGDVFAKSGDFQISDSTRFCVVIFVDSALKKRVEGQVRDGTIPAIGPTTWPDSTTLEKYGLGLSTPELGGQGRVMPIDPNYEASMRVLVPKCQERGDTILLNQVFELNSAGNPYKVTLTARQGHFFWTKSIERSELGGRKQVVPGLYEYEESANWDPFRDLNILQKYLEGTMFGGGKK